MCVGVHLSAGTAEVRDIGSPRAGVTRNCELPGMDAESSGRASGTCSQPLSPVSSQGLPDPPWPVFTVSLASRLL